MRMKLDNRFHKLEVAMRQVQADIKNIKKMVGKETQDRLEALEEFATYADNMLTELNHALPDPEYDAKCEENEAAVNESLDRHRERLGLNKPQLKQLDQSVFYGADPKYITAATNEDGRTFLFPVPKSELEHALGYWFSDYRGDSPRVDGLFDASNWQNSLIERDTAKELLEVDLSSELTGSELCKAMFARGATMIMCAVSNSHDQKRAITKQHEIDIIHDLESFVSSTHPYVGFQNSYRYATPINNQGEPLTASEVGL